MISDTECHRYETKPKRKTSKYGKDELDMLMNCRPIDMTVKNPRPTVQIPGRCAMPASIEELAMGKPCIVDEVIHLLERLNHFFATTYLGQVFLLFITIVSLTSYSIMYYRYTNIKLAFEDLDKKSFGLRIQAMELDVKLTECEYFYDRELKKKNNKPDVPKSIVTDDDQIKSATNLKTKFYQISDYDGPFEMENEDINPTKLRRQFETEATIDKTETISTFDLNDDDDFEDDFVIPSIRDDYGRMVWVGQDEPDAPPDNDDVDNSKMSLADLVKKVLAVDNDWNTDNWDTEVTLEYESTERGIHWANDVQGALIHPTATKQHKSMDESKSRKEEKKIEKTKTKWETADVEYIIADRYHSTEKDSGERKLKLMHERKQRKENEKNKENKNNKDRKESKGKKDKYDKENHDSGKWNKAERKRDVVYEHRFDN